MQLFRPKYRVEECLNALRPVLESGWTGPGPHCKGFEEEWSRFTGAEHCHYVHSCTAALHIALRLLDLPKGSKVCTTGLTFVSTNAVILYEGMIPVFCDVDKDSLSLDPKDVIEKIKRENAKAVIWVHYGGSVHAGFDGFMAWARSEGIKVIEDCAHAGGAFYCDNSRVGSRRDTISCFSFQAVKNLPTFDGGMICVQNEEQLSRVKKLAWMGIDKDTFARTNSSKNEIYKWQYDVPELGWKYNGSDVSATLAQVGLKYLDHDNSYRERLYEWYDCFLNPDICQLRSHHSYSSFHLIVGMMEARESAISSLKANGIAPGVHYLPNMFFTPFSKYYRSGDCPVTEFISKRIISLPNHLEVTREDVRKVCEIINETAS